MMDRNFLAVSIGVEELTRLVLSIAPELSSLSPEVRGVYAYADQDTQEVVIVLNHPSFHRHRSGDAMKRHRITSEDLDRGVKAFDIDVSGKTWTWTGSMDLAAMDIKRLDNNP